MEENRDIREVLEGYEVEIVEESRSFSIIGEVNENTVINFNTWKESLSEWESPVTIQIHSFGGCSASMFAIIGLMEDFKELHGVVLGECYSAALGIFASCHKRSMKKYSECMFHLAAYSTEGNLSKHKDELKLTQKIQDKYESIIMSGCNLKKKDFKRNKDWYLNKEMCIEIGLVNVY